MSIATLVAVFALGCGDEEVLAPDPERSTILDIVTSAPGYAPGEVGTVEVRNKSMQDVTIDVCPPVIDRWSGEMWMLAAEPSVPGCEVLFAVLRPRQTARSVFEVPTELEPGEYRFRFKQVFDENDELLPENERVSNVFEVARDGAG